MFVFVKLIVATVVAPFFKTTEPDVGVECASSNLTTILFVVIVLGYDAFSCNAESLFDR